MTVMRTFKGLAGIAAIAASVSCGDVSRTGRSPAYLVINSIGGIRGGGDSKTASGNLLSDVITNVTKPAPCSDSSPCPTIFNDLGEVEFKLALKDIGTTANPTAATQNNEITILRYHVSYRRADGRNVPGKDVPYGFDGGLTGTVPTSGTLKLGFELVRHMSKEESPLVQLKDSPVIISTIADVTFYGVDQVGNEVTVTGSLLIDFGNFGDL